MKAKGTLRKMDVNLDSMIHYHLNLDKEKGPEINGCVGKPFKMEWTGQINCIATGKSIKKTFGQGFSYDAFMNSPLTSPCIIRPELCEAHLGKGRDPEWEEKHHNQPHYVYLAQTSDIKVGVTRTVNVPSRWIDQGAWRAAIIAEVPYRQLAGLIEVELKQYLSDRTDWRKMLTNQNGTEDISDVRDAMISFFPENFKEYAVADSEVQELTYPVIHYPEKVTSINLDKEKSVEGILTGIRGQYLYFDESKVINLRKYSGYQVAFECQ
ncbi:MAG: DUF2797 domain-containing protein [Bacteroidota bacterium]